DVVIVPPVVYRGEVVSSTIIRREVAEGDVSHAGRLLGRPFALTGEVITGTCIEGESRSHRSVTNIGTRPTFNGSSLSVETHLLDSQPAGTPQRMEVRFWKRLREEKKFSGPEELRAQIAADIASANSLF